MADRYGTLRDGRSAGAWLTDLLEVGSGWNDAVHFCRGTSRRGEQTIMSRLLAARVAEALAPSRERHLETMAQGRAFLDAASRGLAVRCPRLLRGREVRPIRSRWPARRRVTASRSMSRSRPISTPSSRTSFRLACGSCRSARPPASGSGRATQRIVATRRAGDALHPRRSRLGDDPLRHRFACGTRRNTRGCSAHDAAQRPAPRRHRRPRRRRQDDADRDALQGDARPLFDRRHHQRHLHQGGRADPEPRPGAAGRAHPRRGDRRLPAYGDPRGRLHQPRRRLRRCARASPIST